MKFAGKETQQTRLAAEFEKLHPDLVSALEDFEEWSAEQGLPAPVITCLYRSEAENRSANGHPLSYHRFHCAADIRNFHYTPGQNATVFAWLRRRCPQPEWGLKDHDAGSGQHLHLERKDESWRNPQPPEVA